MKDRVHRPPPLELAPPKRQHKVAVPGQRATSSSLPDSRISTTTRHVSSPSTISHQRHRRSSNSRSGRATFSAWVQLLSDAVQVNVCAILIAALGTFLYQVPTAAGTRAGSTAMAAITLLTLSVFLSLISMFRPHTAPNPWTLVVRLILAFSFVAIFLAWVAQVPGPRVFEPPSYSLWGMPPHGINGLIAGIVFVLGVAEFSRAIIWRHTLLGETSQWRLRSNRTRRRSRHHESRHHHHNDENNRPSEPSVVDMRSWPLKTAATSTTLTLGSTSSAAAARPGP
ncbi:hypothetical protein F5X68DRAFT_29560 [Plectosphaerella plurivora]|uniref:Uncharacterized protein n=1 Tax=Plectosphaerella plurivora TaxID=936078 RepID=A0A9P8VIS0_9PEZI|nr:hypothetical protein F5X68DRAFT_29560 [Plectosphaerella plurivora]